MKKVILNLILVLSLTACEGVPSGKALSTDLLNNSTQNISSSDTSNSMNTTQKYLYTLASGVIFANPIDSQTGDLIQPQYGIWNIRPPSTQDFYHFVFSPDGKYLYGIDSTNEKVYQYSVIDNSPYVEYQSNIPLTALSPAYLSIGFGRSYLAFGSDGNIYIQYGSYADAYKLTNGVLSYVREIAKTTAVASYGTSFAMITSASNGNHTYTIDSGTNRVVHSVDGVARNSSQVGSGTLTSLAVR